MKIWVNKLIIYLYVFVLTLAAIGSLDADSKVNNTERDKSYQMFIKNEALKKAGFQNLDSPNFKLLFCGNYCYILNITDRIVARFYNGKPDRAYQAYGQGVGEFLYPRSLFLIDQETIAIHDVGKSAIICLDPTLNYKDEIDVDRAVQNLTRIGKGNIAFGNFGHLSFVLLDKKFEKFESLYKIPESKDVNNMPDSLLYKGYLIDGNEIAYTNRIYFDAECHLNIISLDTRRIRISLKWKHPHPPKTKTALDKNNVYSYYIGKHGNTYVIQNLYSRLLKGKEIGEILFFDEMGNLVSRKTSPFKIIDNYNKDDRLFFLDDEGNIRYSRLNEVLQ